MLQDYLYMLSLYAAAKTVIYYFHKFPYTPTYLFPYKNQDINALTSDLLSTHSVVQSYLFLFL